MSNLADQASVRKLRILGRALAISVLALPCIALATPPPWAPAHGWRKKNDPTYSGYSGKSWDHDYGVRAGSCNRAEIGAVMGGIAGGVAGSQVGKGDGRTVAIVVGTVIGAAIGAEIGRRMDETDRSCAGHALELAGQGQRVSWANPTTGVSYQLTPLRQDVDQDGCRAFKLIATGAFGLTEGRTTACAGDDGVWRLAAEPQLTRR
jgi:surface antigen